MTSFAARLDAAAAHARADLAAQQQVVAERSVARLIYGWTLDAEARLPGSSPPPAEVVLVARRMLGVADAEFDADLADARRVADGDRDAAARLRQRRGWVGGDA